MHLALGSDHRGDSAALGLAPALRAMGHQVTVLGECHGQPCDYPDNAWRVGRAVASGQADRGILICGSGIGVSIAANKIKGVRAALVYDEVAARISRSHNDSNVLCLSADMTPPATLPKIVQVWLEEPFEGGRHARRVKKIDAIERGEDPTKVMMANAGA